MVRKITFIFAVLTLWGCREPNTKYSDNFNVEAFKQISIGERVEVVADKIGDPLRLEKITNGVAQEISPSNIKSMVGDRESIYVASYSLQMSGRRDFERFSISIKDSIVVAMNHEVVVE